MPAPTLRAQVLALHHRKSVHMTTTPTLHAQVLALRRTHSARAVAQALSIPLRSARRPSSAGRRFGRRCIQQKLRQVVAV